MHGNILYDETFSGHVEVGYKHWLKIVILVNGVLSEFRDTRPTFYNLSAIG